MLAAIQTYGAAAAATPAAVFPDTSEVRRGERRSFPASGNESGQGVSGAFGGIRRGLAPGGLCPAPGCRGPSEGWRGRLKLSFGVSAGERGGRTVLDRTERSGPLAVQRLFYPEGPAPDGVVPCEAYVLHPPGGLVTGDALEVDAECGPGAKALLTTPAASKFYRAKERPGLQSQSFAGAAAGPGAELEHLPQEAIVFSGARALQETVYRVSGGGALAGWGTVLLGRAAAGESFERGSYEETLAVFRDGELALFERLRLRGAGEPGPRGHLAGPLGLMSRPATSYFLCLGSGARWRERPLGDCVKELRALTAGGPADGYPEFSGATLRDGIMIARSVGGSVSAAEAFNRAAWTLARPALFGREAAFPRIWRT